MTSKSIARVVWGNGINDIFYGAISVNEEKFYNTWKNMLKRCYCSKWHQNNPSYINCSISKEWIYLSNFKKWFDENYVPGYQLDKDLLYPGNKVYGPKTSSFVPQCINTLFTFSNSARGEYPLGVSKTKYSYQSKSEFQGFKVRKNFNNPNDAHFFYLENKINFINQHLWEGYSSRIDEGLMRWRKILEYHLNNRIIFEPSNLTFHEEYLVTDFRYGQFSWDRMECNS